MLLLENQRRTDHQASLQDWWACQWEHWFGSHPQWPRNTHSPLSLLPHTASTDPNDCHYGFILQINDHTWQWNCQPCWINLRGLLSSISPCSGRTQNLLSLGPNPTSTKHWFSRPFIIQLSLVNLNLSLSPLYCPHEPPLSLLLSSGLLSPHTSSITHPVFKHMSRISCQKYREWTSLENHGYCLAHRSTSSLCPQHSEYWLLPHAFLYMHVYMHTCAHTQSQSYFPTLQIYILWHITIS